MVKTFSNLLFSQLLAISFASATFAAVGDFPVDPDLTCYAGNFQADTRITIQGNKFRFNGQEQYMRGLRLANAIIDDLDGNYNDEWPNDWTPRKHTRDVIRGMAQWRSYGTNFITVTLQGGAQTELSPPVQGGWQTDLYNNPFGLNGSQAFDDYWAGIDSPYSRYLSRLCTLIQAADDLGMGVVLSLFYFGQDQNLANDNAVRTATRKTVEWINAWGFTNVLMDPANEYGNTPSYNIPILADPNRAVELVKIIHDVSTKDHPEASGFIDPSFEYPGGWLLTSPSFFYHHGQASLFPDNLKFNSDPAKIEDYRNIHTNEESDTTVAGGPNYLHDVFVGNNCPPGQSCGIIPDANGKPILGTEENGYDPFFNYWSDDYNGPGIGFKVENLEEYYDHEAGYCVYWGHYHQTVWSETDFSPFASDSSGFPILGGQHLSTDALVLAEAFSNVHSYDPIPTPFPPMLNPPPSELQLSSFPVQADGNRYIPIHGDYFSGEAEIFFIEMTNPPLSGWIAAWDQVAVVSPNLMYLVVPEDQHLPPGGVDALVGVVVKKWWLEEYSMESEFFPISVRP